MKPGSVSDPLKRERHGIERPGLVGEVVDPARHLHLGVAGLERDVLAVDGEEVAAEAEGEVHDRRRRRAQAPAEAVAIVRRQLGGERLEVVPCQRLARGHLDAGRLEGVDVGEHDVRLHQRRCGDDRPVGVGDGLPHAFGDVGHQLLAEVRREIGEIALLGEAHDVGRLVVDDVGRGAPGELGDELVVDVVPAALAQLDLDLRVGLVPGGDDLVDRRRRWSPGRRGSGT